MMVVGRGGEAGPPLPPSLSAQLSRDEPHGRLAQLGRAAALHAVGQGFESLVAHSPCSPPCLPPLGCCRLAGFASYLQPAPDRDRRSVSARFSEKAAWAAQTAASRSGTARRARGAVSVLHCQMNRRALSFIIAAQASEAASVTALSGLWGVSRSFRPVVCTLVLFGGGFSPPLAGVRRSFLFCLSSEAGRRDRASRRAG